VQTVTVDKRKMLSQIDREREAKGEVEKNGLKGPILKVLGNGVS